MKALGPKLIVSKGFLDVLVLNGSDPAKIIAISFTFSNLIFFHLILSLQYFFEKTFTALLRYCITVKKKHLKKMLDY